MVLIPVAVPNRVRYRVLQNHDLVLTAALRNRPDIITTRVPMPLDLADGQHATSKQKMRPKDLICAASTSSMERLIPPITADILPLWDACGRPGRLQLVVAVLGLDGGDYSTGNARTGRDASAEALHPAALRAPCRAAPGSHSQPTA